MLTTQKKTIFINFFCFFIFGMLIQMLTRLAPEPEKAKDLWFALPAFSIFVLMVMSMFSWGSFFRSKIKASFYSPAEEALFDLSVGSVFLYILAYALTPIGLFSSSSSLGLWVLLALGFSLGSRSFVPKRWFHFGFLIPIIVLMKLIEGLQFHQHGDAYVTYLPAPRIWAIQGNFQDYLKYSQFFLSTSWESLFAWGTALMGFQGGKGLDISQWFSQWVTGGIGVFGVLISCFAFSKRLEKIFPIQSKWFSVISILALQIPAIRWTQNLAKNDNGIAFWGLAAYYSSIYLAPLSPWLAFFTGLVAGAAVVGKFTLGILGICMGINILIFARQNTFPFIIGGLLGIAPVILRNAILTKNPVFPWLPNIFPSPYLSDFAAHGAVAATNKAFHLSDFPTYWMELFNESHLIIAILLVLLIKKYTKTVLQMMALPLLSFIIFTITLRPSTGIRYQGPTLILFSLFGAYFSFFLIEMIAEKILKNKKDLLTGLFAVGLLATAGLNFFTFFQIGKKSKFCTYTERMPTTNQIGGPAKLWIRQNISTSNSILSFGDVHIYYLIDYPITEVGQSVEFGMKVSRSTIDEAEQLFKTASFDYLYLAGEDYFKDDTFVKDQMMIAQMMDRTKNWNPVCKKFDNVKSQVWDLHCLNSI